MGVPQFPYYVMYVNGDENNAVHGPTNGETARKILDEVSATSDEEEPEEVESTQPEEQEAT